MCAKANKVEKDIGNGVVLFPCSQTVFKHPNHFLFATRCVEVGFPRVGEKKTNVADCDDLLNVTKDGIYCLLGDNL